MDDVAGLASVVARGCLVRVLHRRGAAAKLAWLGVATPEEILLAPTAPKPPWKPGGWMGAWEGDMADGVWMLGQCRGVDTKPLARAAVACVRTVTDLLPKGEFRPQRVLDLVQRWCDGQDLWQEIGIATMGEALRANNEFFDRGLIAAGSVAGAAFCVGRLAMGDRVDEQQVWASDAAGRAAVAFSASQPGTRMAQSLSDIEKRRSFADFVRWNVPLGIVMLARINDGEAP